MRFGLFHEFPCREGITRKDVFQESFALVDAADRFCQLKEELGLTEIIYEINFGCQIPHELQLNSMRLMTERVVPNFK